MNHPLFKSKKFWTMVITLVLMISSEFIPQLADAKLQDEILQLGLGLIGAFMVQDVAINWNLPAPTPSEAIKPEE